MRTPAQEGGALPCPRRHGPASFVRCRSRSRSSTCPSPWLPARARRAGAPGPPARRVRAGRARRGRRRPRQEHDRRRVGGAATPARRRGSPRATSRRQSGRALLAAIAEALDADAPHHRRARPRGGARSPRGAALARARRLRRACTGRQALAAVSELADRLPAGSRLTIISRSEPALALGRLRARRRVVELRRSDLVLTSGEATAALRLAGIDAPAGAVDAPGAPRRGLAGRDRPRDARGRRRHDARCGAAAFAAAERRFADYVRDEVFSDLVRGRARLPRAHVDPRPAHRTAVRRRRRSHGLRGDAATSSPAGPACSSRSTAPRSLVPPPPAARRRAAGAPGRSAIRPSRPTGHARASRWYAEAGEVEPAVVHAASAGDAGAAGDLLFDSVASYVDADGRRPRAPVDRPVQRRRGPPVPGARARRGAQRVDPRRARPRRAPRRIAAEATDERRDAGAAHRAARRRARHARVGRPGRDLTRMADDAARGGRRSAGAQRVDRARPAVRGRRRSSCSAAGPRRYERLEAGRAPRRDGRARRPRAVPRPARAARRRLRLARRRRDPRRARTRARGFARPRPVPDRCARPRDVGHDAGRARVRRRGLAATCARRRSCSTRLVDFVPWYEAEARVALARAELRLSNVANAKQQLQEAARILRATDDAPVLRAWIDAAWARVDAYCAAALRGARADAGRAPRPAAAADAPLVRRDRRRGCSSRRTRSRRRRTPCTASSTPRHARAR